MKKPIQFIGFLILVAIVASSACLLTRHVMPSAGPLDTAEAHHWIHNQLQLTPEQDRALDSTENRYSEERRHLIQAIRLANMDLGQAILKDKGKSPRVDAAIGRIHAAQGQLQTVTIEHVFEMKSVLTPDQYEKLLKLTADALTEANREK